MSYAERMSFDYVEQTCPAVDALTDTCLELVQEDLEKLLLGILTQEQIQEIGDLVQYRVVTLIGKVKNNATEKMREALIDCCYDLKKMEDERDNALSDVDKIEQDKDRYESDADYYKTEADRLENLVYELECKLEDKL